MTTGDNSRHSAPVKYRSMGSSSENSLLSLNGSVEDAAYAKKDTYNSFEDNASLTSHSQHSDDAEPIYVCGLRLPSLRRIALEISLYCNLLITLAKLIAYIRTLSLSVLAALLDSVLDVVSQIVLNYTEKHSSMSRSSAFYPAGASRLEPIGVLTCAALMGMASFEVLKESFETLFYHKSALADEISFGSFWSMLAIVVVKLALLWLCNSAANKKSIYSSAMGSSRAVVQLADPTLEAL